MQELKWGVLGTAWIAQLCVPCIQATANSTVVAVGSRDEDRARSFADQLAIERAYGSYEAVLADSDVDAVYMPLPNSLHHEWTLRALEAGKHVLCEKPLTDTAACAQELFDAAERRGLVLVEAFMYRHHPQVAAAQRAITSGALGRVEAIYSTFFTRAGAPEINIRYRPELGGGALWDVGSYCVSVSTLLAGGAPEHVSAVASIGATGVDVSFAGTLSFANGCVAQFACGIDADLRTDLVVIGTDKTLVMRNPWLPDIPADIWHGPIPGPGFELYEGVDGVATDVAGGNPYQLQAENFVAAVRSGGERLPSAAESVLNVGVLHDLAESARRTIRAD